MPSGNFDEPVTASPGPDLPPRAFRFPAHYYTAPLSEVHPLFPRWVPIGCGSVSAVVLVLLFAGGALMTGSRLAQFMDFVLGTTLGELKGMYAPDVTAANKEHFDAEVQQLREGLRNDKVTVQNLQPFLKGMQSAMADKKVTAGELERLATTAHSAFSPRKRGEGSD